LRNYIKSFYAEAAASVEVALPTLDTFSVAPAWSASTAFRDALGDEGVKP
jgi:hypothetical protein